MLARPLKRLLVIPWYSFVKPPNLRKRQERVSCIGLEVFARVFLPNETGVDGDIIPNRTDREGEVVEPELPLVRRTSSPLWATA